MRSKFCHSGIPYSESLCGNLWDMEVGTSDGETHTSEYSIALQRIILENADEIFRKCKEDDREGTGVLNTSYFCDNVSSVLGVPSQDVLNLLRPFVSPSNTVAYASWLLNLQQDSTINSPRRQNPVSTPESKATNIGNQPVDTNIDNNQHTFSEHQGMYSNTQLYTSMFDEDDSEDFGNDNNTSNGSFITSQGARNRRADVRISRSGSIYLDLKDGGNSENDANPLEITSSDSNLVQQEKSMYDDLWEDASQNPEFRNKLEKLEFTLRLERDGQASKTQIERGGSGNTLTTVLEKQSRQKTSKTFSKA